MWVCVVIKVNPAGVSQAGCCCLRHTNPAEPVTADLPVTHTLLTLCVCVCVVTHVFSYRKPHLLDTHTLSLGFSCTRTWTLSFPARWTSMMERQEQNVHLI